MQSAVNPKPENRSYIKAFLQCCSRQTPEETYPLTNDDQPPTSAKLECCSSSCALLTCGVMGFVSGSIFTGYLTAEALFLYSNETLPIFVAPASMASGVGFLMLSGGLYLISRTLKSASEIKEETGGDYFSDDIFNESQKDQSSATESTNHLSD